MTVSKASLSKIQYTTPIDDIPDAPTLSASNVGTSRAFNNGSATITATNVDTGGGNVTSYTVTPNPATTPSTFSGTSPITATNLVSNTSYTFTATATNAKGVSPFSSPATSPITATTVPDVPTIGTATRTSNTIASLTFTPPASTGGSAITSYVIESSPSIEITTQAGTTSPLTATGTFAGDSTLYTFTIKAVNANGTSAASSASNSLAVNTTPNSRNIDFLVIAGGGSGGGRYGSSGGAGGMRSSWYTSGGPANTPESPFVATPGTNYSVTIGTGGASRSSYEGQPGFNGTNTSFATITSIRGGRGTINQDPSEVGGSGGGSAFPPAGTGTAGQGHNGGSPNTYTGGGGGGAGSAGSGSSGGAGRSNNITGSSVTYAAGNTGQPFSPISGSSGDANTGSAGGGAGGPNPSGSGGSGVVILRWLTSSSSITVGAGLTSDATGTDGSYSYKRITAGTGDVSFS